MRARFSTASVATAGIALLLACALAAVPSTAQSAQVAGERLVYEITVTNPGTRSQGWHGTLYDRSGQAMDVAPGQLVTTSIGDFASVACAEPWVPCGMIHSDTLASMETSEGNGIMDDVPWAYKLYVMAEGTKSEGWRGELLHGDAIVAPQFTLAPVLTPMGSFVWTGSQYRWGFHDWFPEAWAKLI